MSSAVTSLPPPLSDSPSVETLERLLVGLHQPLRRGVPRPPVPGESVALSRPDQVMSPAEASEQRAPAMRAPAVPPPPPTSVVAAGDPSGTLAMAPSLSWSAGRRRWGSARPVATALGVAVVAAAAAAAGLVATGELSLP